MKKIILIIAIVLLFSLSAMAQVPSKPFSLYGNLGVSLPQSPDGFKDFYKMGLHANAGVGFAVAPTMQLVGKLGYHRFGPDKDALGDGNLDGGTFTAMTYGVDLRASLGVPMAPIKPFGFAGIGMASLKVGEISSNAITDTKLKTEKSETKFYFNFGGGLEFKSGPAMSFFIQASYTGISVDDTFAERIVMIPISLGVKF